MGYLSEKYWPSHLLIFQLDLIWMITIKTILESEDINKAIKATARTITKSKLSDKIRSEVLLQKSSLKCLNEAFGKQKHSWIPWVSVSFGKNPIYSVQGLSQNTTQQRILACLSQVIPPYPLTSWQESGIQFLDSNMHLLWGLPNHLLRSGQKISPDEHQF